MITPKAMSPAYTRGTTCFVQTIWGNQVKIPRISQGCQNNQGRTSQKIRSYFSTNIGHYIGPMITRGISPIVDISQSPREANLSKVPANWGKSMQVQSDILINTQRYVPIQIHEWQL